jgi:hypothetical protein
MLLKTGSVFALVLQHLEAIDVQCIASNRLKRCKTIKVRFLYQPECVSTRFSKEPDANACRLIWTLIV